RLYLAAIHYNKNSDRPQAVDKTGKPAVVTTFPKYTSDCKIRAKKVPPKYDYVKELKRLLLARIHNGRQCYDKEWDAILKKKPVDLSSERQKPSKDEARDLHKSRFPKKK
ncbi:unnamed protein product, partial [Meganyctiphanes norvegica]